MGLINWTEYDKYNILNHAAMDLSQAGFSIDSNNLKSDGIIQVYAKDLEAKGNPFLVQVELMSDLKKSDNPNVPLQLDVFDVTLLSGDGDWTVDEAENVYLTKLPDLVWDLFVDARKILAEEGQQDDVETSGKKVYKVQVGNSSSFLTLSEDGLIDHYRKEVENVNRDAGWDYTKWMVRPKTIKQALKTAEELGDTVTEVEYNPEDISYTEISAEEPYQVKVKFYLEPDPKYQDSVLAVFPEEDEGDGYVTCYAHLGQHGTCSLDYVEDLKEATYDEYKDLLEELKMIGYDPIVLNESKCETSDNKQAVINDIKEFLEENITNDGSTYYMELSPTNGREYLVLLDWVEGFEPNDDAFVDADGYGLEASIRWDENQYFKSDNPYPYYDSGEVIQGHHISSKKDIEWVAEALYDDYIEASEIDYEGSAKNNTSDIIEITHDDAVEKYGEEIDYPAYWTYDEDNILEIAKDNNFYYKESVFNDTVKGTNIFVSVFDGTKIQDGHYLFGVATDDTDTTYFETDDLDAGFKKIRQEIR